MARYEDDVNEKTNSDGHDIVAGKSYTDQRDIMYAHDMFKIL